MTAVVVSILKTGTDSQSVVFPIAAPPFLDLRPALDTLIMAPIHESMVI